MKVSQKTIAVTGAGGGIGSEVALELLHRGARVAALDLKFEGLEALKARAGEHAERLSLHTINSTDRDAVMLLPDQIAEFHGAVDGLINVAGIVQPFTTINDTDFATIERVMNVNFYGTVNMTKAFLPGLMTRPDAHIMNVSSMGGFLPVPGQSVYGASKAAVKLFTEGLYAETLGSNVHVSVVFPGATKTNITANSGVAAPSTADASKYKMLEPSAAAKIMIDGMEKNKMQIFTGSDSRMMNLLYRLSPSFATKFIAKQMSSLLK